MNGEVDFAGALSERVGLLKGLPVARLDEAAGRIRYMPGGATLVATMKQHGAYCALVSGGFTHFTRMVAARLDFDFDAANVLVHDGKALAGTVEPPILGKEAKLATLRHLSSSARLATADASLSTTEMAQGREASPPAEDRRLDVPASALPSWTSTLAASKSKSSLAANHPGEMVKPPETSAQ